MKIDKNKLYEKLNNLTKKDFKKLKISFEEIQCLKDFILNDKLGLKLNFSDLSKDLLKENYILLNEQKKYNINLNKNGIKNNILIEGENFYALKALNIIDFKVDIIYIDPPYNTGNDFIFKDKRILKENTFKHSSWLSFMKKRLELAKELLTEKGVIFISIDDNEQAYLKVLMDEIFGERNFVKTLIFKTNSNIMKYSKNFRKDHEYILIYKNDGKLCEFEKLKNFKMIFKNPDNDKNGDWFSSNATFKFKEDHKNTFFILLPNGNKIKRTWRFSKEDYEKKIVSLFFKNNNVPRIKIYKKNYNLKNKAPSTLINIDLPIDKKMDTFSIAKNELKIIFGKEHIGSKFETPKPTKLIKWILKKIKVKNPVVLDFFAGSGTTAQAVMELNQEDGGKRRFILITNNENKICKKITYERIYRIINGKSSDNKEIEWKFSNDILSLKNNSLRYLKIKLLDKFNGEFEEIDKIKKLYLEEFDKNISIKNFFKN